MLLDTHAWVELMNDSPAGRHIMQLIQSEPAALAMPSISELAAWALRNGQDPKKTVDYVKSQSTLIPFSEETARYAGQIHYRARQDTPDFGMVDAMIYATALLHGQRLVTGDPHFRGKPSVIFIEP